MSIVRSSHEQIRTRSLAESRLGKPRQSILVRRQTTPCQCEQLRILESHFTFKKGTAITTIIQDAARLGHFTDEMKTVVLTNHVLGHFNEYCYRCMSCKISWPDRTQLLKQPKSVAILRYFTAKCRVRTNQANSR